MITDNGTDWSVQGNAVIIYHMNEEAPLWLSKEDLEQMIKQLEAEQMTDQHKQYAMEDVKAFQAHFKQQKIELLDQCHNCLTDAINLLEDGPIDENLVLIHFDIKAAIESIEKYTKELLK